MASSLTLILPVGRSAGPLDWEAGPYTGKCTRRECGRQAWWCHGRFDVWPYLEQFALDVGIEIREELGGHKPDLIIGNYSDGNLVATLLAYHMNVTQCTIAHALEKTKYANADINWYGVPKTFTPQEVLGT